MVSGNYSANSWKLSHNRFIRALMKDKELFLMLLPGFLAVLVFSYGPMFGLVVSFFDYEPIRGIARSAFVGLANFRQAIVDPFFKAAFVNTIVIKLSETMLTFPVSVILALFLNEVGRKYKRIVQTATILPYFVSWIVIAAMFKNMLTPSGGLVNELLMHVFGFEKPIAFMSENTFFPLVIIFQDAWKMSGYFALIYLSAMTAIDPTMYEVATVDGAGRWRQMWNVTLPCIKGTLLTMLILLTGYIVIGPFEQIFAQYSPSVYDKGDIVETYAYRLGLTQYRYGFATAVGLIQSILASFIVVFNNIVISKTQKESIF